MPTALRAIQPAPTCTEHELVAAVRRGSDEAFEELFARFRGRIGSYVLGMVGDHGRAEDVAQEVFISALRRLRATEQPIAFKPWIYEIARNACIDEFRRTRRVQEVPLELDGESGAGEHRFHAPSVAPDAAVESKQSLTDLRGAFRGLSETHHRVLVMRELEGLSYNEIGDRLGMSKPMVQSTLLRARRRLSHEYDELVSGRRCEQVQTTIAADGERPLRALGVRQRRQLARHLAHCQPCRRQARMAGIDDSFFHTPGVIGKITALLPFPWLRPRRARADEPTLADASSHPLVMLQSLQTATQYMDPSAASFSLGRAAATAAAIVVAGAGGGFATGLGGQPDRLGSVAGLPPSLAALAHQSARGTVRGARLASQGSAGTTSQAASGRLGTGTTGPSSATSSIPAAIPPATGAAALPAKAGGLAGLQLPIAGSHSASAGVGTRLPKLPAGASLAQLLGQAATKALTLPASLPQVLPPAPSSGAHSSVLPGLQLPDPSKLLSPLAHRGH
jgi:RNA polymerase sigma factor (sigma-70 family)